MQGDEPIVFRPDITVLSGPEIRPDRRERFAVRLSKLDLERRDWKRRVEEIHINTNVVIKTVARFKDMLHDLDGAREGQCFAIPAASGAGKSHLINRLKLQPMLVPYRDSFGPVRPLIHIKAPSPCTLKTLGLEIFFKLTGEHLSARTTDNEIWRQVVHQMNAQLVSIIMIDEFHHSLCGRTGEQQRLLAETLKNLIIPNPDDPLRPPGSDIRPVSLVLSGMPWFRKVLKLDKQLHDRCIFNNIEPLGHSKQCLKKAEKFLSLVESELGFPNPSRLSEPDMVQRMLKASNGYTGRMMRYIKRAAFRAIQKGSPCIDQAAHLGVAFEEIFELGPNRNPFLMSDVSKMRKIKETDFERLTLLKGMDQTAQDLHDGSP